MIKKIKGAVLAILLILAIIILTGCSQNKNEQKNNGKPTNLEIMSYAQTVLDRELTKPLYSRDENDYKIVETNLRYKIEGMVNSEKFYMIIEFDDDTYSNYTLISLQVGNKKY